MEMKRLIDRSEYSFLKDNPDLTNIIYLVLSGSRAYGTSTEKSDFDLRGTLIEPLQYLYGLRTFEQFEDAATDTVIFGLKKFARLLAKANPNALELLGVDEDCIVSITDKGRTLRENAGLFLSKRAIGSFGNYALAQLRRLQNALCHDNKKSEGRLFKHAMHLIRLLMTGTDILNGKGIITNRREETGVLMDIRGGRIPFEEIFTLVGEYQTKFELAAKNTKLPDEPDMKAIDRLLEQLYQGIYLSHGPN